MLREQAEHMDAPDRCSSLNKNSCAAGRRPHMIPEVGFQAAELQIARLSEGWILRWEAPTTRRFHTILCADMQLEPDWAKGAVGWVPVGNDGAFSGFG